MLKQDALKQLERMNANKREKTLRWIMNKGDRIEKFKLQQQILSERKRKVKDEVTRKKAEYEYQFQKMFHKKNIDQKMINDIHKMFPNNEKINYLLQRLIELDEEEKIDLMEQEQQRKEMDKMLKTTELELKKTFSTGHNNNNNNTNYNKTTSKYTDQFINSDNVILEENTNTKNANSEDNLNSSGENNLVDNKNVNNKTNSNKTNSNEKKLKSKKNNKINKLKDTYEGNKTKNSENLNQISTNQKTEGKNTKSKKNKNNSSNKKEKEIQEKLENYKQKLSNELLELISNEKKKEAERIEFYNMANNKEKEILFKQLGEERAKSALLIVKKNEEIVKKYKDYEMKLRENYN